MLDTKDWFRPAEIHEVRSGGDSRAFILVAERTIGELVGSGWTISRTALVDQPFDKLQEKCVTEAWNVLEERLATERWISEGADFEEFQDRFWYHFEVRHF